MAFRFWSPGVQFFTNDGNVLAGGSLTFTDSGTTNPRTTWSDPGMTTPNPNPAPLDGAGRPNNDIWGDGAYRVTIKNSLGATVGMPLDNVSGPVGIPDPALQAGNFLTNDGTDVFWVPIRQVPDPAGQPDDYVLTVDGGNAIWQELPAAAQVTPGLAASNVDAWALAGSPITPVTFTLTIGTGVVISSHSAAAYGLDFKGFVAGSIVNFINNGKAGGKGGKGGKGGQVFRAGGEEDFAIYARPGQSGGAAIRGPGVGVTFNVTNGNGFIFGGGGGGGGGGCAAGNGGNAAGGGGGGGAGGGDYGDGSGMAECSGGPLVVVADALDGTAGSMTAAGIGGAGAASGGGTGGTGGTGGDFGVAGSAGASPGGTSPMPGGAGGAAGLAIDLDGGTINFVSGNTPDRVKGSVA